MVQSFDLRIQKLYFLFALNPFIHQLFIVFVTLLSFGAKIKPSLSQFPIFPFKSIDSDLKILTNLSTFFILEFQRIKIVLNVLNIDGEIMVLLSELSDSNVDTAIRVFLVFEIYTQSFHLLNQVGDLLVSFSNCLGKHFDSLLPVLLLNLL